MFIKEKINGYFQYGFILGVCLLSCQPSNPPKQVATVPKPSAYPLPTPRISSQETSSPSNSPTPAPVPTSPNWETACLPVDESRIPRKLHFPTDLAVSRDGLQIYVVNAQCASQWMLPNELANKNEKYLDFMLNCDQENLANKYPQQFIYQLLLPDHKLVPLKIQGQYPGVCLRGDELEMDEQNRLYFNTRMDYDDAKRIYRIDPAHDKAEILLKTLQPDHIISQGVSPAPNFTPTLKGPVFLSYGGGKLFFQLYTRDGYRQMTSIFEAQENQMKELIPGLSASDESFNKNFNFDGKNYFLDTNLLLDPIPVASTPPRTKSLHIWKEEDIPFVSSLSFTRINSEGDFISTSPDKHRILKIIPNQDKLISLAGNGSPGYRDGQGSEAQFNYPGALALDAQDNIYVVDTGNHAIRKITPEGQVSTLYKEK